jgi:hypothetical protein
MHAQTTELRPSEVGLLAILIEELRKDTRAFLLDSVQRPWIEAERAACTGWIAPALPGAPTRSPRRHARGASAAQ